MNNRVSVVSGSILTKQSLPEAVYFCISNDINLADGKELRRAKRRRKTPTHAISGFSPRSFLAICGTFRVIFEFAYTYFDVENSTVPSVFLLVACIWLENVIFVVFFRFRNAYPPIAHVFLRFTSFVDVLDVNTETGFGFPRFLPTFWWLNESSRPSIKRDIGRYSLYLYTRDTVEVY